MKTKILLRIAAGCIIFFAFGHSMGHITRHSASNVKVKEVLQLMVETKFDQFGTQRSFDENYTGMSLNLILTLLAIVTLLWILSGVADNHPQLVKRILIPVALCILGFGITSYLYFFILPAITCLVAFFFISLTIYKLK